MQGAGAAASGTRAFSADARVQGQAAAPELGEPLLRKALSSKASHSSRGSSFVKQLSSMLGLRFDDDLQESVMGTMLLSNEVLEEIMTDRDKAKLDELGGVQSIARGLGSSPKRGLTGNDSIQRKQKYGVNLVDRAPSPSFWELFWDAMQDTTVIILLVAAGISIALSFIVCEADLGASCPRKPLWGGPVKLPQHDEEGADCSGWLDGACIIMACLLVGVITAWNEQAKELQFRGLQKQQDECALVTVKRNGEIVSCQAEEIMVGDLVQLDTGARVPADGLFLKGNELKLDESSMTGETEEVTKSEDFPYLCSGTTVTNGDCTYLVTAVGYRSEWGKILSELASERDETPLQEKLTILAEDIGKAGTVVATLCFVAQFIIWLIDMGRETCFFPPQSNFSGPVEDCALGYPGLNDRGACLKKGHLWKTTYQNWSWMKLKDLVSFFIDSVTIIVVAVPEGLPLAVTIALAYSVKKMQKDKNLVRVMAACETMGGCTNICSDKTGTLTQNVMTVVDGYFTGWACEGELPTPAGKGCRLSSAALKVVSEAIACNSKAEIGFDAKKGKPNEIIGNKTEGALLLFVRSLGCDYRDLRDQVPLIKAYPFSSAKKRMSSIVQVEDSAEKSRRRLYSKGASETMLQLCSSYMDQDGSIKTLTPELRARVAQYISKMASLGLRTLTITFKDLDDKEAIPNAGGAGVDELAKLEKDLVLVAACGIKDPLRKEVPEAVRKCQRAGITVRMLTGDSLLTAKNIAKDCGILTRDGTAMEGPDFRKLTAPKQKEVLRLRTLPNGQVQTLQVLARCSPQDKLTLVKCLKEMGEVVAVTGDGTNDAPALKEADVGLSMGIAGTAVAQEASDIIIMDDNFSSIVQSVMWGRSVYDNIRRFLQFQLTVNVVALTICLVGAVTGFGTPLKPVQLLWVNLIMDTFGALALATEDPTADLLNRKPYGRFDKLVNAHMWRNIGVQSVYQLSIQLGLLWFGVQFLTDCSEGYGTGNDCRNLEPNGQGKNLSGNYRDTVIYNTFVWMQLFNEINCRRIFNELNMINGVFNNPIFVAIWVFSAAVQVASVQFGGKVFHTVPLDAYDWVSCIAVGAFSLVLGVFQRFVPICYVSASAPPSEEDQNEFVTVPISGGRGAAGDLNTRLLDEGL